MITLSNSTWGIKRSGHDIAGDIIGIIHNADNFIIVGGYNFTFKTVGYSFFRELRQKALQGLPILIILPSHLYGNGSNQPAIINFCIINGIGVILNGNNHSKWILTDKDLYYGSSNFSVSSWKNKVEVVTIHNHSHINRQWKVDTVNDFKDFVKDEIKSLKRRHTMTRVPGLIVYTRIVWNGIKSRMFRLNPSIEKVIITLENYENVVHNLEKVCSLWFETENFDDYNNIKKLSRQILKKVDQLCSYAYSNIYNESLVDLESKNINLDLSKEVIENYNKIHLELIIIIEDCKNQLEKISLNRDFNLESKNQTILTNIDTVLTNGNYS
ncbi:phospholipase D-like domain-containing protein [Flavobacterium sp. CAU 1735]|uniref:phospholipase D-like domain-containing protein n=1 Tax=Flavobacterium sp. CAU 1735 TaxID=3140361 RepID=UPI003261977A